MEAIIIEREALLLPEGQRALLADRLLQSLGSEDKVVMDAWADEAEERFDAYERGDITAVDGSGAVEEIRRSL